MGNTAAYNFELIDFDKRPWHSKEHNNWHIVDSVFSRFISINNIQGVWGNAISTTLGDKYVDGDTDTIWEALVTHTTSSTGTFAADRITNPSFWTSITIDQKAVVTWAIATT